MEIKTLNNINKDKGLFSLIQYFRHIAVSRPLNPPCSPQIWFTELPLEALWLANIYDWFGGSAVWYLGVYTFAADITAPGERASRMAR